MTELQMGLIGLGVVAVVGVLGLNKWQEYRQRKLAEAVFKPTQNDVLLDDRPANAGGRTAAGKDAAERSEPALGGEHVVADRREPVIAAEKASDPLVDENLQAGLQTPAVSASLEEAAPLAEATEVEDVPVPVALLDPRLEFIVAMELVEPVNAEQVLHSQRAALRRLNKAVQWVAFNDRTREWERINADSSLSFRRLRIGLQLVNRLGPLSEADLTIFTNAMQALADELLAVAVMPSTNVLDQAIEIDRFCAAVDLEIGLNLISRGASFPGTKIRALAEAAGFALGVHGVFVRYDEGGRAQFSLHNYESTPFSADALRTASTHGLTFVLDVPRVEHGERVFSQMLEVIRRFADTLQGSLVDDNRQPLTEAQLEHIRREFIGKPQATMASYGLGAGSPQALRLFS